MVAGLKDHPTNKPSSLAPDELFFKRYVRQRALISAWEPKILPPHPCMERREGASCSCAAVPTTTHHGGRFLSCGGGGHRRDVTMMVVPRPAPLAIMRKGGKRRPNFEAYLMEGEMGFKEKAMP